MPSSKEDSAAAAAEQLGSISLGGSAERKNNDADEPTAKNSNGTSGAAKKMCSACGKESDALKKCNGCLCVWYCDKECQNKHRKEHKKECKRIKQELDKRGGKLDLGTELDVGPLGKVPQREDCAICMRVLPLHTKLNAYAVCCGKSLCGGCNYQHQMKSGGRVRTCAFCRTAVPRSEEEYFVRLRKRAERKDDPHALCSMALEYRDGGHGMPVDQGKCIELLRESADLGYPPAQYQIGTLHHTGRLGLKQDQKEALKYWKKAAEGGDLLSRHNLGWEEEDNGDHAAAMRHWRLSASGGSKRSMATLIRRFEVGLLHHADLAKTLRAFYSTRSDMKSTDRDQYIAYLKMKGEYDEQYDL